MQYYSLLLSTLALAITSVNAQAIDTEDVPSTCQSACAPVIAASDACEELENDEDASDWVCVCAAQGMSTAVPECLSCVQSAPLSGDDDDDDGGDILAGLGSCGFSAAPASSAAAGGTSIQPAASASSAAGGGSTQPAIQTGGGNAAPTTAASSAPTNLIPDTAAPPTTTNANGVIVAATPSTTPGPSQAGDAAPSDLEGSRLTVITATIGSGDNAMVATLTSVVPGPVVTQDQVEQQIENGGVRRGQPAAAAAALGGLAVVLF